MRWFIILLLGSKTFHRVRGWDEVGKFLRDRDQDGVQVYREMATGVLQPVDLAEVRAALQRGEDVTKTTTEPV